MTSEINLNGLLNPGFDTVTSPNLNPLLPEDFDTITSIKPINEEVVKVDF